MEDSHKNAYITSFVRTPRNLLVIRRCPRYDQGTPVWRKFSKNYSAGSQWWLEALLPDRLGGASTSESGIACDVLGGSHTLVGTEN